MRIVRTLAFSFLVLSACSDPRSHALPSDVASVEHDEDFKKAAAKLPEEEKNLLALYLIRAGLAIEPADRAKTIGEAIAAQKRFQADQEAADAKEAAKAKKRGDDDRKFEEGYAALRAECARIKVTVPRFAFARHDPAKRQMGNDAKVTIHVENGSQKTTKALKGFVFLKNASGEKIGSHVPYEIKIPVAPGGRVDVETDVHLASAQRNATFEPTEAGWSPEDYAFEDGQSMLRPP